MTRKQALYVWQEQEESGAWGTITAVIVPTKLHGPLLGRTLAMMQVLKPLAEKHAQSSGHKVALRKYIYEEPIEEI